jgi:hypothetical protein
MLLENIGTLRTLKIKDGEHNKREPLLQLQCWNDATVEFLAARWPQLEKLDIFPSRSITWMVLPALLKLCPNLCAIKFSEWTLDLAFAEYAIMLSMIADVLPNRQKLVVIEIGQVSRLRRTQVCYCNVSIS